MKTKVISFFLILLVFWIFFSPGPKTAPDFHLTQKSVQINNIFPSVWKETAAADGLGEYYAPQLWSSPLHVFFGLMALINLPFEVQEKLLGLIILLIGFSGIRKLLSKYGISEPAKSAGAVFFLLNSFFLLLFDGGQLSLALAYSILPLAFYYLLNCLEADELKDKLKFAASVLALSIADIRIVYLIFPVVFIYLVIKVFISEGKNLFINFKDLAVLFKRLVLSFSLTGIIFFGFHAYWLLPAISESIDLPAVYDRTSQVSFLSFSSLAHSVLLQSPHWPQNVFGRISHPKPEFIIIPFLAFLTLILTKKMEQVFFWLLIASAGIFLSKGSNGPLGEIYPFLFSNIPGFAFFRDPMKFYFLTALSYSILIAFSAQILARRKIIAVIIILYFVFLSRPAFLGQMNGLLAEPLLKKEFAGAAQTLSEDKDFSRVLWLPSQAPLGYVSGEHPALGADRLAAKRPFAQGTKGTYERFNFLREAPYMGEIFDVAGIGYIAYLYPDSKRADMHHDSIKYYYDFLGQLSQRPWLERIEDSPIPLFKTKQHQERFFIAPDIWWIVGSDSILNEFPKSEFKLAKNALIFSEEYAGSGTRLDEFPEAKIVLSGKTLTDLAAGFIPSENLIFPAVNLGFDPDVTSGWWKREAADLVWWRNFLQEKYGIDNQDFDLGGGWAIGEGKRQMSLKNSRLSTGKILLTRVMESSKSGTLKFLQGDTLVGEIETKIDGPANVRWFEVGKLAADKELIIKSFGDINVVNALAILDPQEHASYQEKAKSLKTRIVDFAPPAPIALNPAVSYERINSTKYKVKIAGLSQPAFLVFSQNYDPLWKLNGQTPLPVYSLLNGFRIDHDGEYIIEYEPQKYVYPGLAISAATILLLLTFLLRRKKLKI